MKEKICPYAKECGGCDYQGMAYSLQIKKKQMAMEWLLGKYCKVMPIIAAKEPFYYRNKVHGVLSRDKYGNVITGIYKEGTHKLVPVKECQIEDERASRIIRDTAGIIGDFKYQIYDEDSMRGLMRHILVRVGKNSGEIMLIIVTSSPIIPSKANFVRAIKELHPEIDTIVFNINDKKTTMVLGKKNIVAYGKGYIYDTLCGYRFKISPTSFYQINAKQTELLYEKAMEYAGLTGREAVIDAYCGIGTIGIVASKRARRVIGVELNKEAVNDARENARLNKRDNITFVNEDAGKYMVRLALEDKKVDVVLMDPPRSGSTKEFIDSVAKLSPKRVVYISCGPESLERDLKYFKQKGFGVKKIQPVDLFPFTGHCENVCLLSKKP